MGLKQLSLASGVRSGSSDQSNALIAASNSLARDEAAGVGELCQLCLALRKGAKTQAANRGS